MAPPEAVEARAVVSRDGVDTEPFEPDSAGTFPPSLPDEAVGLDLADEAPDRPIPVWTRGGVHSGDGPTIATDQAVGVVPEDATASPSKEHPLVAPWVAHRQRVAAEPKPEAHERKDSPAPALAPAPRPAATAPPRLDWLWGALVGTAVGALLGVALSILLFVLVNGAFDVGRTRGVESLRAQISELSTEVDAIRTDSSSLQGSVETLSGAVEDLQAADVSLHASLDTLGGDVDTLAADLAGVQEQAQRTVSFFERLRTLLDDTFGEGP